MSEKIIFLDVDGVLNYMSYRNKSTANIFDYLIMLETIA